MTLLNHAAADASAGPARRWRVVRQLRQYQEEAWLAPILLIVFMLLVIPPLVWLLIGSFYSTARDGSAGVLTLANYTQVLTAPALLESALNSVKFALGSALLALVLGGVQAWIVERTNAPLKALALIGAIVSLATPYILYVIAVLFAYGRLGPISAFMRWIAPELSPSFDMQSLGGMIFVEGLLWTPLVFLMLAPVFRAANPSLEEAALACGASNRETLYHVTMKLVMPVLLAVLLLVFVKGVEAFEVPALVGLPGNINVLTTEVYLSLKMSMPPDLGRANAFAVLLIVMVAVLLALYQRLMRHAERYQTMTGKAYQPRLMDLGRGRWIAAAVLAINFVACVVLPILSLLWTSLLPFYQMVSTRALSRLTLKNYEVVLGLGNDLQAIWNTLLLSFATATIAMALCAVTGWMIARGRPAATLFDQIGSIPLVFPGIVLAVAVMQIFLWVPLPIYGTLWILLIAFTVRYIPYGLRYATAGVIQLHSELEEAASTSGASLPSRFMRVVIPLIGPALASGWLFVFLLTARDLSMPVLLSGPNSRVVAVQLYDLWVNGQATELAAFGLIWTALMTGVAALAFWVARRLGNSLIAT
jgi:iron(III) transport system permease protein